MKFLVTGGGGFVGKALCYALKDDGHEVRALARGHYPELTDKGVELYRADLSKDPSHYCEAFEGIDAVFHVAAKVDMWGKYEDFWNVNVVGTRNVIESCRAAKIPRLIYTSSPSVVADGNDLNGIDESYPYPDTHKAFYPATKSVAEREVLAAHSEELRTCALRPHLIWGPGDNNFVPTILERARAGRLVRVGEGENLVDVCYIEDCVRSHVLAERAIRDGADAGGRAYFISQGEPVKLWEWIDDVLVRNGLQPIKKSVPFRAADTIAMFCEFLWKTLPLSGDPFLTRFLVSEMATNHYFSLENAKKYLGFQPEYDIQTAMQKTFG